MSNFNLSEFDPALRELSRLHVIIRLPEAIVEEFSKRIAEIFTDVTLRYDQESGLLLLIAGKEHEAGVMLPRLAETIWEFDYHESGVKPEILETRMSIPEGMALAGTECFSRFIALNEENGDRESEKFQLKMSGSTVFGSGNHPSTRLAVKALEHLFAEGVFPARVLDVGCGSGILSFCSCLFGAHEVLGIDISSEAVATAAKNRRLNSFVSKVVFTGQQLPEVSGTYDLVIANVSAAVMTGMLNEFPRLVGGAGRLLLSGLLGRQQQEMGDKLRELGFKITGVYGQDQWRAMLLAAVDRRP